MIIITRDSVHGMFAVYQSVSRVDVIFDLAFNCQRHRTLKTFIVRIEVHNQIWWLAAIFLSEEEDARKPDPVSIMIRPD